jgi:ubiquinone/menaquinone biosynthesis C-methylase UbiE
MNNYLVRSYNHLLNFLFHLLYHSLAWSYDLVAWLVSFGNWRSWINTALPYLVGPNILELGFGTGHLQRVLQSEGVRVFGVDESFQMCLRVNRVEYCLCDNGYAHYFNVIRGITQSLPFPNRVFNSVVSTFPSDYIFDPHTLYEISRVLLPGGKFVIVLSATLSDKNILSKIYSLLFRLAAPPLDWQLAFINALSKVHLVGKFHWVNLPTSHVGLIIGEKVL